MTERSQHASTDLPPNILKSTVDATSARYERNMRAMADLVAGFRNQEEKIC